MAKAILVLDEMPENCNDCMAFTDDPDKHDYCWCQKEDRKISWQWVDNFSSATYCPRPDWCPLKELPERKTKCHDAVESGVFAYEWATTYLYEAAWNECLDAIEGTED